MNQKEPQIMQDLTNRPMVVFTNAIKSAQTRKQYLYNLRKFMDWCNIRNAEDLINKSETELQILLENYLFYLKGIVSPNSLNPKFAALELFFSMNNMTLNFKKIRKMFPAKVKKSGRDYWSTEQITEMLKIANNRRTRALIHILASAACRIGSISPLKLRHVKDYKENCKMVTFYEGTNEEYIGFLTPEASKELDSYLRQRKMDGEFMTENSPLFRDTYRIGSAKAKHVSEGALQFVIKRVVRHLDREKTGNRYNIQTDHGFRKRFNTILKSNDKSNPSLVEKLMGHQGVFALDGSYLQPSDEILFEEFKKHILQLTIDNSERDKIKIKNLELEKSEIEKNRVEIEELKQKLEEIQYDRKARINSFANSMLNYDLQNDSTEKIFSILFHVLFEMSGSEEEKRRIWKRALEAAQKGEKFDFSWLGDPANFNLSNYFGRPVSVQLVKRTDTKKQKSLYSST